MENSNQLLKPAEAAAFLSISVRTLYTRSSRRKIASVKLGRCVRFRKIDLEAMIRSGYRPALEEVALDGVAQIGQEGGAA